MPSFMALPTVVPKAVSNQSWTNEACERPSATALRFGSSSESTADATVGMPEPLAANLAWTSSLMM